MPQADVVKKTLRNQRPAVRDPPRLEQLGVLPPKLRATLGEQPQPFLIYDNGEYQENRILVFANPRCLALMNNIDTVYMDGNFAMAPAIFSQVYCLRIPIGADNHITAVYALLPNKRRATYEAFLTAIVNACANVQSVFHPGTTMTDFEVGMMRAIRAVLGHNVNTRGCYYHLTQSTWRHIQ